MSPDERLSDGRSRYWPPGVLLLIILFAVPLISARASADKLPQRAVAILTCFLFSGVWTAVTSVLGDSWTGDGAEESRLFGPREEPRQRLRLRRRRVLVGAVTERNNSGPRAPESDRIFSGSESHGGMLDARWHVRTKASPAHKDLSYCQLYRCRVVRYSASRPRTSRLEGLR